MTLLVSLAVAGIALGGVLLASGAQLSTRYNAKEAMLQSSADGGLELIRDSINRGIFDSLLPSTGFTTLASNVAVKDALGATRCRGSISRSMSGAPADALVVQRQPVSTAATLPARSR